MRILLVEDDPVLAEMVKRYLGGAGFDVSVARTGAAGLSLHKREAVDAIVLDLMLPDMDGLEVCKRVRAMPSTAMLPIIMLTAKAEESDTVIGLELGADDYVTKPFSPKALTARVRAMLRRLDRAPSVGDSRYCYGPLTMDLSRHEVRLGGEEVPLTAKEFGLLEYLLRNPGRVLTRDILLNAVWGYDYYGTTRTVDVHIRRLKQKLPLLEEAIVAVKSIGYKLKEQ